MQRISRALFALALIGTFAACADATPPTASLVVRSRPVPSTTSSSTSTSTSTTSTTVAPTTTTAAPVVPATDPPAPAPPSAPDPAPVAPGPPSGADSYPSLAWWTAIATCESGNTNAWRTGYFGIEAGYAIGGLSYEDQLAWARRIFAASGPGAWGCWATVGGPY